MADIHRDFFMWYFPRDAKPEDRVFRSVAPGKTYVVYAINILSGFPFYFIERESRDPLDWGMLPGLCFEVIDDRPSALWRFRTRVANGSRPGTAMLTTLAIQQWVDEPMFYERVVDGREREFNIMREAARRMDAEFD